jgi:enamine deaminase RidA (YjgF/YER057c/UK114 family)
VFSEPPYPPNTLVVIQSLAEPHFLIEIEAIAVVS